MKVSILGCGWLGLPLAEALLQAGHTVWGSTTRAEKQPMLAAKGIKAHLINLADLGAPLPPSFFETDALVLNIPPGRRTNPPENHVAQLKRLAPWLGQGQAKRVLYVSSTSVYPIGHQIAHEDDPLPPLATGTPGLAMRLAEQWLQESAGANCTIIRSAGLMGYDRVPGKYFAGQQGLETGHWPVNYVHRDDAVAIIGEIIQQQAWGHTWNMVAPLHPTRQMVYWKNAELFNFAPPQFTPDAPGNTSNAFKIVNGNALCKALQYKFLYPDPLGFYD